MCLRNSIVAWKGKTCCVSGAGVLNIRSVDFRPQDGRIRAWEGLFRSLLENDCRGSKISSNSGGSRGSWWSSSCLQISDLSLIYSWLLCTHTPVLPKARDTWASLRSVGQALGFYASCCQVKQIHMVWSLNRTRNKGWPQNGSSRSTEFWPSLCYPA